MDPPDAKSSSSRESKRKFSLFSRKQKPAPAPPPPPPPLTLPQERERRRRNVAIKSQVTVAGVGAGRASDYNDDGSGRTSEEIRKLRNNRKLTARKSSTVFRKKPNSAISNMDFAINNAASSGSTVSLPGTKSTTSTIRSARSANDKTTGRTSFAFGAGKRNRLKPTPSKMDQLQVPSASDVARERRSKIKLTQSKSLNRDWSPSPMTAVQASTKDLLWRKPIVQELVTNQIDFDKYDRQQDTDASSAILNRVDDLNDEIGVDADELGSPAHGLEITSSIPHQDDAPVALHPIQSTTPTIYHTMSNRLNDRYSITDNNRESIGTAIPSPSDIVQRARKVAEQFHSEQAPDGSGHLFTEQSFHQIKKWRRILEKTDIDGESPLTFAQTRHIGLEANNLLQRMRRARESQKILMNQQRRQAQHLQRWLKQIMVAGYSLQTDANALQELLQRIRPHENRTLKRNSQTAMQIETRRKELDERLTRVEGAVQILRINSRKNKRQYMGYREANPEFISDIASCLLISAAYDVSTDEWKGSLNPRNTALDFMRRGLTQLKFNTPHILEETDVYEKMYARIQPVAESKIGKYNELIENEITTSVEQTHEMQRQLCCFDNEAVALKSLQCQAESELMSMAARDGNLVEEIKAYLYELSGKKGYFEKLQHQIYDPAPRGCIIPQIM